MWKTVKAEGFFGLYKVRSFARPPFTGPPINVLLPSHPCAGLCRPRRPHRPSHGHHARRQRAYLYSVRQAQTAFRVGRPIERPLDSRARMATHKSGGRNTARAHSCPVRSATASHRRSHWRPLVFIRGIVFSSSHRASEQVRSSGWQTGRS